MKKFLLLALMLVLTPQVAEAALVNDSTGYDDVWGTPTPVGHWTLDSSYSQPTGLMIAFYTGLFPDWEIGVWTSSDVANPYVKTQLGTWGNTSFGLLGGAQVTFHSFDESVALEGATSTVMGPVTLNTNLGVGYQLNHPDTLTHANVTVYYTIPWGQTLAAGLGYTTGQVSQQVGITFPWQNMTFTGSVLLDPIMGWVPQVGATYTY